MATAQPTSVPVAAQPLLQHQQYTPPNSQGHPQVEPFHPRSAPSSSTKNHTPSTPSPTFHNAPAVPQLPLAQRQIRPPKSPMYIPAALRPTDRPQRASPLTPPRSLHGSTDSLDNKADATRPISRRSTDPGRSGKQQLDKVSEASPREESTAAAAAAAPPALPPASPIDSLSDLVPLTGDPPTRHHWKSDVYASICDGPTCQKGFGLFERRHHCRHCGNVFCKEHSGLQIPLDQNADFHPGGWMVRCCGHCLARYEEWVEARRQIKMMGDSGVLGGGNNLGSGSPVRQIGSGGGGGGGGGGGRGGPRTPEAHKGSFVGSLSRDWNWSTF